MVKYCAVAVCKNGSHNRPDLLYFRFPSDQKPRKKWETFCRRADEKFKTLADLRICSQHFSREDLKRTLSGKIEVISCGVPTIFDPKQPAAKSDPRQERKNKRDRRAQHLADNSTELPVKRQRVDAQEGKIGTVHSSAGLIGVIGDHDYTDQIENVDERQRNVLCQTELTMEDLAKMERGINQSSISIPTSSQEVKVGANAQKRREQLVQDVLKSDESEKVKYWDKNKRQKSYYQNDPEKEKPGRKRDVGLKEEFILVLLRLKLGLMERHLADMFAVSVSTVSRIYMTWVRFLALTFNGSLLRWPSKQEITTHMPNSFSKYPGARVIIDCTEFFIEKPSSPSTQKATWSDYKHHNTVKLLVGITPSGAFSFISKLWSGSTSDRRVTQESGLIDLLEEGDQVMADRGFIISDLLTKKGVKLNMPPFTKGNY
ncbi:uncharacterized protein [Montipora foliosa]|uniref:uncharacterized protein n=1 Tax=Montipora foliosa TaxID=591990 RepID=UPI0035F18C33